MSVELRKITEDNFRQIMEMKVAEDQSKFVAPNMLSLAQAWLEYDTTRPFAIYADDEPVGFLMLSWDVPKKECHLWRVMVDARFQGKGYGKPANKKSSPK
ncbi:MAG: GNAT family N-acetyltransferase [Oscillospiraceae bacterium]